MDFRASVANKQLTVKLNPLDATFTENMGVWGAAFIARSARLGVGARCTVAKLQETIPSWKNASHA